VQTRRCPCGGGSVCLPAQRWAGCVGTAAFPITGTLSGLPLPPTSSAWMRHGGRCRATFPGPRRAAWPVLPWPAGACGPTNRPLAAVVVALDISATGAVAVDAATGATRAFALELVSAAGFHRGRCRLQAAWRCPGNGSGQKKLGSAGLGGRAISGLRFDDQADVSPRELISPAGINTAARKSLLGRPPTSMSAFVRFDQPARIHRPGTWIARVFQPLSTILPPSWLELRAGQ